MNKKDSEIIDSLGGTGAVAAKCGVKSQAVSQWRKKGIPRPWRIVLLEKLESANLTKTPTPTETSPT